MNRIEITRHVAADPDRAFRAWTDADELARWWWPQWPGTTYRIDATTGGAYRIENTGVGVGVRGEFTELDPPRSLTMTWIWLTDGRDAELEGVPVVDTVTVTFTPAGGGTDVTVTHTSVSDLTDAAQGWNDVLDRLPAHGAPTG